MRILKWMLVNLIVVISIYNATAQDKTGIIEVKSTPSGAKVYVDGIYVGKTPYSNPEINVGSRTVKIFLNDNYPAYTTNVRINEIDPVIINYQFDNNKSGEFSGIKEEFIVEIKKGNVQFASVPSGAKIYIKGKNEGNTPLGYKDVAVGQYQITFDLNGKRLKGIFRIYPNYNEKIIAYFNEMQITSKHDKEIYSQKLQKQEEYQAIKSQQREETIKTKMNELLENTYLNLNFNSHGGWVGITNFLTDSDYKKYRANNEEINLSNYVKGGLQTSGYIYDVHGQKHKVRIYTEVKGYGRYKTGLFKNKNRSHVKFYLEIDSKIVDIKETEGWSCGYIYHELAVHYNSLNIKDYNIKAIHGRNDYGHYNTKIDIVLHQDISSSELRRIAESKIQE